MKKGVNKQNNRFLLPSLKIKTQKEQRLNGHIHDSVVIKNQSN